MSANTTLDMNTLEQLSPLIRIFAHPLRLRILDFLETSKTPQRVTEIVGVCEGAQQAIVSQQLKIMRDMGILDAERRKNCVYYSIKNSEILYFMSCVRNFDPHSGAQPNTPTAKL